MPLRSIIAYHHSLLRTMRRTYFLQIFQLFIVIRNAVFWDVTPCSFGKNRRFRLLVTADVPRSPILVILMMEAMNSSEPQYLKEPNDVTFH
jgi:hypothetical protein